jgi:hypothetical protein
MAKRKKDGKTVMVAVQAPEELHRTLKIAAVTNGVTLGAAVLRGLELYIEESRKKNAK